MSSYDGVLVATASAGTGKTTALIARLLGWALGEGWERTEEDLRSHESEWGSWVAEDIAGRILSRVVCITFTEKAAAQMVEKFAEGLGQLLEGKSLPGLSPDKLPEDPGLLEARIAALTACQDQLNLTTIHAFCRGILARHPLEAGLHPGFVIDADQRILDEVCKDAVESAVRSSLEIEGEHAVIQLLLRGINPLDIAQSLHRLVMDGVPPSQFDEDPFPPALVLSFVRDLTTHLDGLIALAGERFTGSRTKAAQRAVNGCMDLLDFLPVQRPELEILSESARYVSQNLDKKILERLREWHRGGFTGNEVKELEEHLPAFRVHASSVHDSLKRLKHVNIEELRLAYRALGPLLQDVHERLRVAGVVTFPKLLSATAQLLANHPNTVCAKERRRLDQLMVDEFQDTDELQCSIIRTLALRGDPSHRPGLFLVGDPKQSIYGWRNADLTTYTRFIQEVVEDHQARMQPLSTNWRSCPEIIDEVNRVFGQVMEEEEGFQPAYAPLNAPSEGGQQFLLDRQGPWAPVEYWASWDWDEESQSPLLNRTSEDVSRLEAESVAQDLIGLRVQGALDQWGEAMVLFRTTSALDRTLQAFREAGIPYAVERDRNYYRRREIIEASALVRSVMDPMDHVALVTLLRSAMVGVPDAAWLPLWQGLFPSLCTRIRGPESPELDAVESLAAKVAETSQGKVLGLDRVDGWHHALASALRRIAHLRASLKELTPVHFVDELRNLFLIDSVEGARFLGDYRVANLELFFRVLVELMEAHGSDKARVVRELRTLVTKQMDAEEAKPLESGQDAVRVMTIHKSKGLKARHVYMMGLHRAKGNPNARQSRGEQTRATNRSGEWEFKLFGVHTLGYKDVLDLEERIEQSESLRTLYVGMTRATERLVLLGQWPDPTRGKGQAKALSHLVPLQACTSKLRDVAEAFSECGPAKKSSVEIDGQRWVFPVLRPRGAKNQQTVAPVDLPALNAVEKALEGTKERRLRALERQARPLGEAVTAISSSPQDRTEFLTPSDGDALVASLSGTAVHAFMEHFEGGDPLTHRDEAIAQALQREIHKVVAPLTLTEEQINMVYERAHNCIARFMEQSLFKEFCDLEPNILARELSLVLPAREELVPLSYVSGTLDMLYRDPEDGAYVVVDYKSDEVESDAAHQRAKNYAQQGELYCEAVDQALPNERPARFELWFLYSGTRVELTRSQQGH